MSDPDFAARREAAIERITQNDAGLLKENPHRDAFFEAVYDSANGDEAMVPWADLAPKPQLLEWLAENPGDNRSALDVGCGLGDNAEALANGGYRTTAFDFSALAIEWARKRFPGSRVEYRTADLFDLPDHWHAAFDLVHECYTLQSIPPETLDKSIPAIASLVAPGGTLLVYTRVRDDGSEAEGPPWPLEESRLKAFSAFGLKQQSESRFNLEKGERRIPVVFAVWENPA